MEFELWHGRTYIQNGNRLTENRLHGYVEGRGLGVWGWQMKTIIDSFICVCVCVCVCVCMAIYRMDDQQPPTNI